MYSRSLQKVRHAAITHMHRDTRGGFNVDDVPLVGEEVYVAIRNNGKWRWYDWHTSSPTEEGCRTLIDARDEVYPQLKAKDPVECVVKVKVVQVE
jgi:hypothetical protein